MTTLEGERVRLRPPREGDEVAMARWAADPDFAWYQWGRAPGRWSPEGAREWLARFEAPRAAIFIIEHAARAIGFANYRELVSKAKSVEVGIGIGEPALWSKGLGREALALLLRHLTGDLGLHRVTLGVVAYNDRAIAMYKALGFEVEAIERDAVMTDRGHFVDRVRMAYLAGRERPAFDPRPVTLEGRHVRLRPLWMDDAAALFAAGDEDDIWRYVVPRPVGEAGYARYVRDALDGQLRDERLPFVVVRLSDGELVGTTSFTSIHRANRSIEIGYTFYGKGARRTAVNTECKYLLLRHAFDTLGAIRVWLQTDKRNERSQEAIARLGATREGELRANRILADGRRRTSVVFGITVEDWPSVRARLEAFLGGEGG